MENNEEIPPVLPPKTAPRIQNALKSFYISANNGSTKDEAIMSSPIKPVNIAVVAPITATVPSSIIQDEIPSSRPQSNGKTASSNCYGTTVFVQSKEELNQVQDQQSPKSGGHVVTIRINPNNEDKQYSTIELIQNYESKTIQKGANKSIVNLTMKNQEQVVQGPPYFFYTGYQGSHGEIMSSGQCSPSDTLDSGTCSDLDSTPPPLPKKKNFKSRSSVMVNNSLQTDSSSEETESNVSCDSLTDLIINTNKFPVNLLQDIRERGTCLKLTEAVNPHFEEEKVEQKPQQPVKPVEALNPTVLVNESTYEERKLQEKLLSEKSSENKYLYDTDRFYNFHLNENVIENVGDAKVNEDSVDGNISSVVSESDESFAGYKDLLGGSERSSTIRSAKGTIRGVKNRVRAGIATFLQIQQCPNKSYREKDAGRVVVYSTTMGIVRETYQQCLKVKKILRTHMVKFEERDVFMSNEYQCEIRDRMQSDQILIPQVYVDGQHIGDAETIERLNESGELRRILKPYKSADACSTCQICGGYRLLPCPVCNGSKKSVHRNHFTTEFVALKCMNCDEVGLVRCYAC